MRIFELLQFFEDECLKVEKKEQMDNTFGHFAECASTDFLPSSKMINGKSKDPIGLGLLPST